MKLCTDYWVSKVQQWLVLDGAEVVINVSRRGHWCLYMLKKWRSGQVLSMPDNWQSLKDRTTQFFTSRSGTLVQRNVHCKFQIWWSVGSAQYGQMTCFTVYATFICPLSNLHICTLCCIGCFQMFIFIPKHCNNIPDNKLEQIFWEKYILRFGFCFICSSSISA